ncbi:sulfur carrier protein ThiS [Meiothermus rufus]|uniref:sulfur carrier protein ThiS n=1 Tax=Meiothermus rufus TaxID=604332 RepID=UPI0004233528|nr:sulfur carrier protein ThiS [Meiothermus rufus]
MLWVNGEARPWAGWTLGEVLKELGLDPKGVAILIGEEAFPAEAVLDRVLEEGERVELVTLMQGG